jgi:oligosaccharyltransferase complex subunit alpha (ribophorin I)
VVKVLPAVIPTPATDLYYRDDIGNVSTSSITYLGGQKVLVLQPRYPLYGGWKYAFHYGFNAPLDQFGVFDTERGTYKVQIPFAGSLSGVFIQKNAVKIVLPEGAT